MSENLSKNKKLARASLESMYRVFTVPEAPESTLGRIDKDISSNLAGFLQDHIVAVEQDLQEIEKDFSESKVPEKPIFVSEQTRFLLDKLVARSVHTASPSFVGHMTSALPYFMLPLSKIMIALNQNLVKTETSKAFTPLERQVLGMLHRLVYEKDDDFYARWMHEPDYALGAMCSGGTIANVTALWAARNLGLPPENRFKGVVSEGLFRALKYYGYEGAAIVVSKRGHYSISKTADVLGIGRDFVVSVETDDNNRIDVDALRETCADLKQRKICILAIVGIAGTTETGHVDPLNEMADIAKQFKSHFHVDAAWGGPTLFSQTHRHLLEGIERADSVTLDAHKQLYVPMGCGLVLFKDPEKLKSIEHHANYVIRAGSRDLGAKTLEGSRPGMAMLVHSGLKIIAREGYEILIDQGISKAKSFAAMIDADSDFELVSSPELNIVTYRYCPAFVQEALVRANDVEMDKINAILDRITKFVQKVQREKGLSFVSRTRLEPRKYNKRSCVVFRAVLANPLTTVEILEEILVEQKSLVDEPEIRTAARQLVSMCENVGKQSSVA